ncbi:hypothetical protein D3C76_1096340 [compost metagenome]
MRNPGQPFQKAIRRHLLVTFQPLVRFVGGQHLIDFLPVQRHLIGRSFRRIVDRFLHHFMPMVMMPHIGHKVAKLVKQPVFRTMHEQIRKHAMYGPNACDHHDQSHRITNKADQRNQSERQQPPCRKRNLDRLQPQLPFIVPL